MELIWKCLKCGNLWPHREEDIDHPPEKCPSCGAPAQELELVEED
jgi:rubrerythrin